MSLMTWTLVLNFNIEPVVVFLLLADDAALVAKSLEEAQEEDQKCQHPKLLVLPLA